ncbi:YjcZ family sporulation protein [Paenibacillus sp. D2_2]|nr:YjcZ family sporulation protein [Paenibacillus sp. D2_2]WMT42291.1 YjcZ family sporulation protein [Paenibacillus sp. D2_2]
MGEVFGGVGGVGYSCGGGLGTSTAAILVLFILLVIISMAFVF